LTSESLDNVTLLGGCEPTQSKKSKQGSHDGSGCEGLRIFSTMATVTYILVTVTLQSILKSLVELYNEPFVDEQTYYDAASSAREAGENAMEFGIEPERVSEMIMPSAVIALVNSYIL